MANVSHATLTGTNLHEPKGITSAVAGTVYISDGVGSGSWTASASIATGMIADFCTPIAPTGWLELDGSAISTTTFATLYSVMTIQQTGNRGSGSAIITGLSSTTNMKAGYYVFGTGITSGTTILTVDSSTQITMSANAASSGSATVIVSPWLVAATTITLPDLKTAGRYRRSRTSALQMGTSQVDLVKNHAHSGTTGSGSAHAHGSGSLVGNNIPLSNGVAVAGVPAGQSPTKFQTSGSGLDVYTAGNFAALDATTVTVSGSVGSENAHTHSFTSGNPLADGGVETRPLTLVVMTCVKV